MSTLTIDQAGTVRLWDDCGDLVDAVRVDRATGRSEHVRLSRCPHLMVTFGGVCCTCCRQVILPRAADQSAADQADDDDTGIDGGMLVLVVACCALFFGLSLLLLWVRWSA